MGSPITPACLTPLPILHHVYATSWFTIIAPRHSDLATMHPTAWYNAMPVGDSGMKRRWAGFIDITPDMLPVIDGNAIDGLVLSTGYSGHGLGIAPAAGRLTAELALGMESASAQASEFRVSRLTHESLWVAPNALI